jgi:hypothetical protein
MAIATAADLLLGNVILVSLLDTQGILLRDEYVNAERARLAVRSYNGEHVDGAVTDLFDEINDEKVDRVLYIGWDTSWVLVRGRETLMVMLVSEERDLMHAVWVNSITLQLTDAELSERYGWLSPVPTTYSMRHRGRTVRTFRFTPPVPDLLRQTSDDEDPQSPVTFEDNE